MPIPKPKKNERQKDFLSRCAQVMAKVDPKVPNTQRVAICYSSWQKVHKKTEGNLRKIKCGGSAFLAEAFMSLGDAIRTAVQDKYGDEYYVQDYSNKEAIVYRSEHYDELFKVSYKLVKGKIEITSDLASVEKKVSYEQMTGKDFIDLICLERGLG